ncbi:MAG: PaaX family transcriptional regulator C-terminal domain-containing protein [Pseudomonadota bacterium]
MVQPSAHFQDTVAALSENGALKVWSILVTIFGDLAQGEDEAITGPVLSAITERLGIKPEAQRVALHRLRKDGWIESRKDGRVSRYQLTPSGRAQSQAASPRIYQRTPTATAGWHALIAPPGAAADRHLTQDDLSAKGYVQIQPSVFLRAGPLRDAPCAFLPLASAGSAVPDWVLNAVAPDALVSAYTTFADTLDAIAPHLQEAAQWSSLERVAARVLILHGWRRLVLRHTGLTDSLFPDGWAGSRCRQLVFAALDTLGEPTVSPAVLTEPKVAAHI